MSSGSAITTGPGRPLVATWKAREMSSGRRAGSVDIRHPLRHGAEHRLVVELLEGLALLHVAGDLADEEDQRRRILHRDVDAGRGVRGARPARDEADAGAAGELAVGLRHHRRAALLAADRDGDRGVVQRVEHGEVALARHAEEMVDAVHDELVDEDLSAGAGAYGSLSSPAHRRAENCPPPSAGLFALIRAGTERRAGLVLQKSALFGLRSGIKPPEADPFAGAGASYDRPLPTMMPVGRSAPVRMGLFRRHPGGRERKAGTSFRKRADSA